MDDALLPHGLTALIKAATRELVLAAGGPAIVKALTGFSDGAISRFQGDIYPDLMPVWAIALLEMRVQRPIFAGALAGLTGHRLAPAAPGSPGDHVADLIGLAQSGAAVTSELGSALSDQVVTPAEAHRILPRIAEHEDRLRTAKANLHAVIGRTGSAS